MNKIKYTGFTLIKRKVNINQNKNEELKYQRWMESE